LDIKRANKANIYSQISERETTKVKPPTAGQLKIAGFADRLLEADVQLKSLRGKFTGAESYLGGVIPNRFKSEDRQKFEQAKRNFINAVLRQESGAAIGKDEFANADQQYFEQPGDTVQTVQQKEANRQTVINSFIRESGTTISPNYAPAPDGSGDTVILTD